MAFPDLDFLLLIVEPFGSLAGAALALPENDGRRLPKIVGGNSTSNPQSPSSGRIALHLNRQPKDITKGFVFGSDRSSCDVLLATSKKTGISANHLSVHIDWVSHGPMLTCLSRSGFRVTASSTRSGKAVGLRGGILLSKNSNQIVKPGTIAYAQLTPNLGLRMIIPTRGYLQTAYDQNLKDYFLIYKNAVPELANISLGDTEVTPLILDRCDSLKGHEYYTTEEKIETGDVDYDEKIFVYNAKCKTTPDALAVAQRGEKGHEYVEDWALNDSKHGQPGELYVVKHFQECKGKFTVPPDELSGLCDLSHLNLEYVTDLIVEPSYFMVVTSDFSLVTLDQLHQEVTLNTDEIGFVVGQIFAALEYLHGREWVHGNLDPRSIRVMSSQRLWVKLADTALAKYFDLGKPDGYHAKYASQMLPADLNKQRSTDVWSAGVVALELLNGLPHRTWTANKAQAEWVEDLERAAVAYHRKSRTQASHAVRMILQRAPLDRPTAAEVCNDPWLVGTRRDRFAITGSHSRLFPEGWNSSPSSSFGSRQGSGLPWPRLVPDSGPVTPSFRQYSDPPLPFFRSSSSAPSEMTPAEVLQRQTALERPGIDFPDWDKINRDLFGSQTSSSVRSHSTDRRADWKPRTVGLVRGHRRVGDAEDSGEETETGRRGPVAKKSRRGKAGPPLSMDLRSRRKGKEREI